MAKKQSSQSSQPSRVRRTNVQIAETNEFFVKEVQKNKELLFGPFSSTVTAAKKDKKWEEIRQAMIEKGDKLLETKNSAYVQKQYWQYVRQKTMERVDSLQVTTGAEPKDEDLSSISVFAGF